MKRKAIAKLVIQAMGACFGILGLSWVSLGICWAVLGIRDSDRFLMFYMTLGFLILGGIVIAVGWQALRHFGPNAIRNVVALVTLSVYAAVSTFLDRFEEAAREKGDPYFSAMSLIPLVLAYLACRAVSKKLIQMTGTDTPNDELNRTIDPRGPGPASG